MRDGREIAIAPYGSNMLVVGTSGSGKSTVATGLLERLVERGYTFCVIDPEGDYAALPDAISLGTPDRAPSLDEALQLLEKGDNAVINLVGLALADRPTFFLSLLPRLQALRARTGQPHWLFIDEAHHLLPAAWQPAQLALPEQLHSVVQISVHPDLIAPRALAGVDTVITVGTDPAARLHEFAATVGADIDARDEAALEPGEALVWLRERGAAPLRLRLVPSRAEHRRHNRKYAEGELPLDRSFYFRGPHGELNLRAQNLIVFLQMADGVDDDTWQYHLRRGDYSRWFAEGIKDEALTEEAQAHRGDDRAVAGTEPRAGACGDRAGVHAAGVGSSVEARGTAATADVERRRALQREHDDMLVRLDHERFAGRQHDVALVAVDGDPEVAVDAGQPGVAGVVQPGRLAAGELQACGGGVDQHERLHRVGVWMHCAHARAFASASVWRR